MRRTLSGAAVLAFLALLAQPAVAKFENATITISGPGLAAPIELSGQDSLSWERYAVFGPRWPSPKVNGRIEPHVKLGPAYVVSVAFDCPHSTRGGFNQTLYPYAPGGPQVFTATGTAFCRSMLPAGYLPTSMRLLHALVASGLPKSAPATGDTSPTSGPVPAPATGGSSRTAIALVALVALAGVAAVTSFRRRAHPRARGSLG